MTIHEYGHYIVGRWAGMKVLRFSVGFGKPVWTWVRGKDRTEFCISAIPLGGYVRFLDGREGPVDPEDEGRAFDHRPVPRRIAVLLAGPLFNFLFAIFAYWVLFLNGIPTLQPAVGDVEPQSYAARAGLEFGDKIVAVGEVDTDDWESTLVNIFDQLVGDGRVPLTLESKDGRQRRALIMVGEDASRLTEPNMLFEGLGFEPWQPPAVIAELTEGGAAAGASMAVGDRIVSIDGNGVSNYSDLIEVVSARPDQAVSVAYVRDGRQFEIDVILGRQEVEGEVRGLLGVRGSQRLRELCAPA